MSDIIRVYSDISAEWLLRGDGSMLLRDVPENVSSFPLKPRIPYDAAVGCLTDTVNGVTESDCEMVPAVSVFPRYDFTIWVTGRSMEPEFYAGDEVACLRVRERCFLQWGRVHVLDTSQGVIIKRIYENGEFIRCTSFNPEYPDFNVPKEDIRSCNLVVGAIRL